METVIHEGDILQLFSRGEGNDSFALWYRNGRGKEKVFEYVTNEAEVNIPEAKYVFCHKLLAIQYFRPMITLTPNRKELHCFTNINSAVHVAINYN